MPPLLEARGIGKRFPGVTALDNVSLSVGRGEVLALIGENGAGKSTLLSILAGVQQPDTGLILVDGNPVAFRGVHDALAAGIALIHQELNLADNLDLAGNIFLGREPRLAGFLRSARMRREAADWLRMVGLDLDASTPLADLPIGRQQLVEIAKALSTRARLLIMDEPTSSLSARETATLFGVVKQLRSQGVSVIWISHRLGEVTELADRVVVLRDGQNAGEIPDRSAIEHDTMIRMMVGRDIDRLARRPSHAPGAEALAVEGLRTPAHPSQSLSFSVRAGEIVGIAGLVGSGRTELLTTLFGVTPPVGGAVTVAGRAFEPRSPRDAIRAGLALVPEDRKQQGLVLEMAVRENMSLASLRQASRSGFIDFAAERRLASEAIPRLAIKTPDDRQVTRFLSGGNQQKVVLAKWLALRPRVLLLDEPTRGIDVGAKAEIYDLIHRLAGEGLAVVFVSSEMEEILSLADRALVMHEGRLAGELGRDDLTEERVMRLAAGAEEKQTA
ncbi:MAG: Ribose import ATP-binding protein RbsA [Planctomycetota bacterium]